MSEFTREHLIDLTERARHRIRNEKLEEIEHCIVSAAKMGRNGVYVPVARGLTEDEIRDIYPDIFCGIKRISHYTVFQDEYSGAHMTGDSYHFSWGEA